MAPTGAKSKRPICPFCSKPARLCLCNRIQNPGLESSVSVTILQHSLERNHPLNSTRIAKLGLKNVTIATVFDVNFEAQFDIRLIEPRQESGSGQVVAGRLSFDHELGTGESQKVVYEDDDDFGLKGENGADFQCKRLKKGPEEKNSLLIDINEEWSLRNDIGGKLDAKNHFRVSTSANNFKELPKNDVLISEQENATRTDESYGENGAVALGTPCSCLFGQSNLGHRPISYEDYDNLVTALNISKYGVISHLACTWVPPTDCQKPSFDQILGSQVAMDALAKGFIVTKMQKPQLSGIMELEEYEEFEIKVSPGSVLLFPSEEAVCIDGLKAMNFEVKNLIVLDGTWSKAKRMYKENPWLKFLPHLKLDVDKVSLYSEVRHQPKAGYLSTIESIVYTLKALGDNTEGLDNLLDVFESMVGDQRRCKDERLSKVSSS
ncbi:putative DTW domain-containing protein [Melia azedarach]|uniref:DTW domain-containing protein n=1 Tax=Melia azedarach TaxID=155640 RepID=A0ACC1YRM0_MELAZ|nr:putative DTW domain-containing protein [Melia azedarach]